MKNEAARMKAESRINQHRWLYFLPTALCLLLFALFRRAMLCALTLLARAAVGSHRTETFLDERGWKLRDGFEGLRGGDNFKLDERRQFLLQRQVTKLRA